MGNNKKMSWCLGLSILSIGLCIVIVIEQHLFKPCYCDSTPEAFHQYITNYFNKRIFK